MCRSAKLVAFRTAVALLAKQCVALWQFMSYASGLSAVT